VNAIQLNIQTSRSFSGVEFYFGLMQQMKKRADKDKLEGYGDEYKDNSFL